MLGWYFSVSSLVQMKVGEAFFMILTDLNCQAATSNSFQFESSYHKQKEGFLFHLNVIFFEVVNIMRLLRLFRQKTRIYFCVRI